MGYNEEIDMMLRASYYSQDTDYLRAALLVWANHVRLKGDADDQDSIPAFLTPAAKSMLFKLLEPLEPLHAVQEIVRAASLIEICPGCMMYAIYQDLPDDNPGLRDLRESLEKILKGH